MERYFRCLPVYVVRCGKLEDELIVRLPHGQYGYLDHDPSKWSFDIGDRILARIYGKEMYERGGIQRYVSRLVPISLLEREELPFE